MSSRKLQRTILLLKYLLDQQSELFKARTTPRRANKTFNLTQGAKLKSTEQA